MSRILLEKDLADMTDGELDRFPLAVVAVDAAGSIEYFNAAAAILARRRADATLGLNFFSDVAPCTAVRAFQGRFDEFVRSGDTLCDEFPFLFRFAWGDQTAGITFARRDGAGRILIVSNAYGVEMVVAGAYAA